MCASAPSCLTQQPMMCTVMVRCLRHLLVNNLLYCTRKCGYKRGYTSTNCFLQPPPKVQLVRSPTWNMKLSLGLSWQHRVYVRGVPSPDIQPPFQTHFVVYPIPLGVSFSKVQNSTGVVDEINHKIVLIFSSTIDDQP